MNDDTIKKQEKDSSLQLQLKTPTKSKLVGCICNDTTQMSWSLMNNREIVCTARLVRDGVWSIEGRVKGTLRIAATVLGGKNATRKYMKFIRNGLVARAMRLKHTHESNRKNRKAAALNPVNPANPV